MATLTDVDALIMKLEKIEGGYVNNPNDSGGETNYGITVAVARAFGYKGDMKLMPEAVAHNIYKTQYWAAPNFAYVDAVYPQIAAELFDTAVNLGVSRAVMIFQRSLKVMQNLQLNADGVMYPGGSTLSTLTTYSTKRGVTGGVILNRLMNCLQGEFYAECVEKASKNQDFIYGWVVNRIGMD